MSFSDAFFLLLLVSFVRSYMVLKYRKYRNLIQTEVIDRMDFDNL